MKTQDAINAVGGMKCLCTLLNCSRNAVYLWGDEVPSHRQYELEIKTRGKIKSDFTVNRQNARRRNNE